MKRQSIDPMKYDSRAETNVCAFGACPFFLLGGTWFQLSSLGVRSVAGTGGCGQLRTVADKLQRCAFFLLALTCLHVSQT